MLNLGVRSLKPPARENCL